jgi:predicted nucleic acid-binding protein
VIVVDAGVVVFGLVDDGPLGSLARTALHDAHAPELLDLEVGSALRRLVLAGRLSARRAKAALDDLGDLAIARAPHRALLRRCWELRDSVTFYDAAYVALAEALGCVLLTTDRPLSQAPGLRCPVDLLAAAP